jgi:hypothetical protein
MEYDAGIYLELKAKLYFEREWIDAQNVGWTSSELLLLVPYLIQEQGVAYKIV